MSEKRELKDYLGSYLSQGCWGIKTQTWDFFAWYFNSQFGKKPYREIMDIILSQTDYNKDSELFHISRISLETIAFYTGYSYPTIHGTYTLLCTQNLSCPFCGYEQVGLIKDIERGTAESHNHNIEPFLKMLTHLQKHWNAEHSGHENERKSGVLCDFCTKRQTFLKPLKREISDKEREARRKNVLRIFNRRPDDDF